MLRTSCVGTSLHGLGQSVISISISCPPADVLRLALAAVRCLPGCLVAAALLPGSCSTTAGAGPSGASGQGSRAHSRCSAPAAAAYFSAALQDHRGKYTSVPGLICLAKQHNPRAQLDTWPAAAHTGRPRNACSRPPTSAVCATRRPHPPFPVFRAAPPRCLHGGLPAVCLWQCCCDRRC